MRPPRWVGGRCDAGHDVTDPANVVTTAAGRACRVCRRESKRLHYQRQAERDNRAARPDRWVAGKCRNGHDTSAPGSVYVNSRGFRECIACRTANRKRSRAKMLEDRPATDVREHQLSPADVEAILALRRRAEDATPWERAELIAQAERIRQQGLPRQVDPAATVDARAANRRKLLAAKLVARRDGSANAVSRHAECASDQRDGAPSGPPDPAGDEVVDGPAAHLAPLADAVVAEGRADGNE